MARLLSARTLVLGGLAVAAAAGALKNRGKVAGLLGRSTGPEPFPPPSEAPVGARAAEPGPAPAPPIANADAPGPPANTATHVPAPDPQVHDPAGGIDEAAEEAAAAAEAANIGGPAPEYAGNELGELADEVDRPLEEAGEGVSEGAEQAEADLVDNAEPLAGDPDDAARQIEDVIEAQANPLSGETPDPIDPPNDPNVPDAATGAAPPDPAQRVADVDPPQGTEAPDAPRPGTPAASTGDTLAAGSFDDGAPTTGGTLSGTTEDPSEASQTSAAEKSANVWRSGGEAAGSPEDQPTVEQPKLSEEDDKPDDDDGSEWQTWSGRAVEP
jgi:hypothetical protein